jgi:tight adherence protein C
MTALIFLTTFAAATFFALYLLQPRPDDVRRRILGAATPNEVARRRTVEGGPVRRLIAPVLQRLGSALSRLLPQNLVRQLDGLLVQAGGRMSLATFLSIWAVAVGAAALLSFMVVRAYSDIGFGIYVVAGIVMFYGLFTPYVLLLRRAHARRKRIERALPDALDLMLTCVEAGLGVDAAFALVAQRSRGPLADVLTDYLRQVGLGQPRREALEDIAQRSGAEGLTRLAATVAQAGAIGTSMGDVLRIQAAEMRETRRLKAQEAAARAPIWMTIPLALCFMPAMGAVIVVPSIVNLINFVGGNFGK